MISTGVVRPKRSGSGLRRYLPYGWADWTLPVNAFLVEHRDGLCLFDTGQTAWAARPGYLPRWHPFLRLSRFELESRDEAWAQLRGLGVKPGDVRWVVLSHLHTDHVGGLGAFARAEVLVSRIEWQRATGRAGRLRGYVPQHWPRELRPRLVEFDGPPLGPFPGSMAIAGDQTLVAVPLQGHTPGHMGLLARVAAGTYLAVGDLVHAASELSDAHPEVAAFCAREGVTVLAAHDPHASELVGGAR